MAETVEDRPAVDAAMASAPVNPTPVVPLWPPFPDTSGLNVIPLRDFVPKGILIDTDGNIEAEVDGYGINTIALRISHDAAHSKKKKRRRRKKGPAGGEEISQLKWHEEWQELEDTIILPQIDPDATLIDRFEQVTQEFLLTHSFNSTLQSIFDNFRIFSGTLGLQAKLKDDDDDDDDIPDGTAPDSIDEDDESPLKSMKLADRVLITKEDPWPEKLFPPGEEEEEKMPEGLTKEGREKYRQEAARRERIREFFNDPARSMKIFLSSYFRDRGLIWSDSKLYDAPLMIGFILRFLIRTRAFPNHESKLQAALLIAEQAKIELPMTKKTAVVLPDGWSQACQWVWQPQVIPSWQNESTVPDLSASVDTVENPDAPKQASHVEHTKLDIDLETFDPAKMEVESDFLRDQLGPEDVNGLPYNPRHLPPFARIQEIDNEEEMKEASTGDRNEGVQTNMDVDDNGGWEAEGFVDDWNVRPEDSTWLRSEMAMDSMFTYLGPTSIPNTHYPHFAEKSTRTIVSLTPPDKSSPFTSELRQIFAVLKLGSWHIKWSDSAWAPRIIDLSDGRQSAEIAKHDVVKSEIEVYVDAQFIDQYKVGMGISGAWIKVGPRPEVLQEVGETRNLESWWYIHSVNQVLPSFWAE